MILVLGVARLFFSVEVRQQREDEHAARKNFVVLTLAARLVPAKEFSLFLLSATARPWAASFILIKEVSS